MKLHKPLWEKEETKKERKLVFKKFMNWVGENISEFTFKPSDFDNVQQICGDKNKGIFRAWSNRVGEKTACIYFGEYEDEEED